MTKPHDMGGRPTDEPIDKADLDHMDWEFRLDALNGVLGQKGLRTTDQARRAIESLEPEVYSSLSYYERWTAGLEILMVEKGILTTEEIDQKVAQMEQQAL